MIRFDMDHCALVSLVYYMKRNSADVCHSFVKATFHKGIVYKAFRFEKNVSALTELQSAVPFRTHRSGSHE